MREKGPPDPPLDVPKWFFTYTDVITLLMTFFVLLLTFATSEPEKFERMQIALFGGGGGTGANNTDPMEKDSILMRERPRSSRMTRRGSEMPPINSDVSTESLKSGLEGMDKQPQVDSSSSFVFDVPMSLMVDQQNQISSVGVQYLRMFAGRLRKGAHEVAFEVSRESDIQRAIVLCNYLVDHLNVTPGRIAASFAPSDEDSSTLRIIFSYNPLR